MKFGAVYRTFLNQPPALGATCEALGAWVRLVVLASDLETDRLPIYKTERESLRAAGVSLAEIDLAVQEGLVKREGEHLVILGFDHNGLAAYARRRAGGAKGALLGGARGALSGKPGGRPRKTPPKPLQQPLENPSTGFTKTPHRTPRKPPLSVLPEGKQAVNGASVNGPTAVVTREPPF